MSLSLNAFDSCRLKKNKQIKKNIGATKIHLLYILKKAKPMIIDIRQKKEKYQTTQNFTQLLITLSVHQP